jgi:hypothetical protein
LKNALFIAQTDNTKNSTSVYKFVKKKGIVTLWQIERDIDLLKRLRFNELPQIPPTQKSNKTTVHQPFCKQVLEKIVELLKLQDDLFVLGGGGDRKENEVYADLIIGLSSFYNELTKNPPDLSKGFGWEVRNDLTDRAEEMKGKGRLIKYARIYLTADVPLTQVFYGCLTDGKLWQFMRIKFINDDDVRDKMMVEESKTYEWNADTASLIASLISHCYNQFIMKTSNNDETNNKLSHRPKLSFTSESLLASFINEGCHITLNSGNCIHVQITSHLGTGRECIVFLAQVRDYGIKDAVLKVN